MIEKKISDERSEMMRLISEHCLPKLVCELYAKSPSSGILADSEKSLMALIGYTGMGSFHIQLEPLKRITLEQRQADSNYRQIVILNE
jgi:hypothetical protein